MRRWTGLEVERPEPLMRPLHIFLMVLRNSMWLGTHGAEGIWKNGNRKGAGVRSWKPVAPGYGLLLSFWHQQWSLSDTWTEAAVTRTAGSTPWITSPTWAIYMTDPSTLSERTRLTKLQIQLWKKKKKKTKKKHSDMRHTYSVFFQLACPQESPSLPSLRKKWMGFPQWSSG